METLEWVYLHTAKYHLRDSQVLVLVECISGESQDNMVSSPDSYCCIYNIELITTKPNKHHLVQINLPHANLKHIDMKLAAF